MRSLLLLASLVACSPRAVPAEKGHPADPETPMAEQPLPPASVAPAPHQLAEREAFDRARPVFDKHCARCHTRGGKKASAEALEHFSLDSFPPGGHHAHDITARIRLVLGAGPGGKAASMPKDDPGALSRDELAAVLSWADAHDREQPSGAHQGHHH